MADILVNYVIRTIDKPIIISDFPTWSSPLYARNKDNENILERSKMYLPGQLTGFDLGMQENNFSDYAERVLTQKKNWNLSVDDPRMKESELDAILACGMPRMFGFGLNPDRLGKVWVDSSTIDSLELF